eukprot:6484735-Alexandrium_andersonii.AAC.1
MLYALGVGPPGRLPLADPAVGSERVRIKIGMALPVVPGDVLAAVADLDAFGEACSASRHRAAPARVLVGQ